MLGLGTEISSVMQLMLTMELWEISIYAYHGSCEISIMLTMELLRYQLCLPWSCEISIMLTMELWDINYAYHGVVRYQLCLPWSCEISIVLTMELWDINYCLPWSCEISIMLTMELWDINYAYHGIGSDEVRRLIERDKRGGCWQQRRTVWNMDLLFSSL